LNLGRRELTGEDPSGRSIGGLSVLEGLGDCILELLAIVVAHEHVEREGLAETG
jgi:hypothetical protein